MNVPILQFKLKLNLLKTLFWQNKEQNINIFQFIKKIAAKMNQNQQFTLAERLKLFYVQDFYQLVKQSRRNIFFSLISFFIWQIMMVQLQIDDTTFLNITSNDKSLSKILKSIFFLKALLNTCDFQNNYKWEIYIILAINCFLLLSIIICLIVRTRTKSQSYPNLFQIFQNYEYLVAIPSLYLSIATYQSYLSITNIFLTLLIGQFSFHFL
ncbi:hypothetical protein ABPG74_019268 [Tetrahymena malaccensis]